MRQPGCKGNLTAPVESIDMYVVVPSTCPNPTLKTSSESSSPI